MKIAATGLAWYLEEQWDEIRKYCTDRDIMANTYDEWLKGAYNSIEQMKKRGIKLYKVVIEIDEFKKYCQEKHLEPNGKARTEFTNYNVYHQHKNGNLIEL